MKSNFLFIHQNTVFLVGGEPGVGSGNEMKMVQSVNFDGVTNLNEAKAKTWSILGELNTGVYNPVAQFHDGKLFVVTAWATSNSAVHTPSEKSSIQIFDLVTGTTKSVRNAFASGNSAKGLIWPIIFTNDQELIIVSGYDQYVESIEQHLKLDDLSVLRTVGVSDSVFQGLIAANGESKRVKFAKIYLNV